jgi:hypothetical protein
MLSKLLIDNRIPNLLDKRYYTFENSKRFGNLIKVLVQVCF